MRQSSPQRLALQGVLLLANLLMPEGALATAAFQEFVDPNPAPGNQFGATVVVLSTGNVVITSSYDDAGGTNAGAVYLFNGGTGALISTLRGSAAGNRVGSGGVTALANGNYVVESPLWDNGANTDAGAVTWGSGTLGVSGIVSAANSLVGSNTSDFVGLAVTALPGGNYVVTSPYWRNGAAMEAGAVTWGHGASGVKGAVTSANSLVGSTNYDHGGAVLVLANGNYVVSNPYWDNGALVDAGAVTWGSGATGVTGVVTAGNSLVGSTTYDYLSGTGLVALANGNYVVLSSYWDNGAIENAGAATWGNGSGGTVGPLSAANSLVGSTLNDAVGSYATPLPNGNYVVGSNQWSNGALAGAGAVTWGNGASGVHGAISSANSLVGTTASDQVGSYGVTVLANGNYVLASPFWDNGPLANAGAVTWVSGSGGVVGTISAANSLVGGGADNFVGTQVAALTNGNYVVASPNWEQGAPTDVGAVTWANGATGLAGPVGPWNSLVGSQAYDKVGGSGVTALTNGNYVVRSPSWSNGAVPLAGAVTWGDGTGGVVGVVSAANSLVGSSATDQVGASAVAALSNGNYVVPSPVWDNAVFAVTDVGAVTWCSGTGGGTGPIHAGNSLLGTVGGDRVGDGLLALTNGNYVVMSQSWSNSGALYAGAVTWGNGAGGTVGPVGPSNSLVGSHAGDFVGVVKPLSDGNYVVSSAGWDDGPNTNAGAATWGNGTAGVVGVISAANSLVGQSSSTGLAQPVEDAVHGTFISAFPSEGGGHVRVGPQGPEPAIVSLVDIPADQGGWLRLTIGRSLLDLAAATTPISLYGVWRKVPGTLAVSDASATASAEDIARIAKQLPPELDAGPAGGRLLVTASRARPAESAAVFPAGTWELVASLPALQQGQYIVAVPTVSNSAPNSFVVTAHTTTPSIWYISTPISAQSVDNLAPAAPTAFVAAYSGGATHLQWTANAEHDLGSYALYRGTTGSFTPSPANRIATQIGTSYADAGPAGSFYKLSALDVNGNESAFALVTPAGTTDVPGGAPLVLALDGLQPNPSSGRALRVSFVLPTPAPARLELTDVIGRRVLEREVGTLGAGRHVVNLAEQRALPAGLYWVRLIQGESRRTARAVVVQ